MREEIPGLQGFIGLAVVTLATCVVITTQSGLVAGFPAWIACGGAIYVGWQAAKAINK